MGKGRFEVKNLILVLPLLFLLFFLYAPLLRLYLGSLPPGGGWKTLIRDPAYYLGIFRFTLFQALLSSLAALAAGLPGAWILARFHFPGKKVIRALTTLPFVMPSILVVLGFILLWGKNSWLNGLLGGRIDILYSLKAIILAHVFYNFPIAIRLVSQFWESLSVHQEEAARLLGAGKIKSFFTITLPQLMPALLSSGTLIFLYCFMSFAIILVLGGGPRFSTMEVEIYHLARFSFDLEAAGLLSLIESIITLLVLTWHLRLEERLTRGRGAWNHPEYYGWASLKKSTRLLIVTYFVLVIFLLIMPLIQVIVYSFHARYRGRGELIWTTKWYQSLLTSSGRGEVTLRAVGNSLRFAFSSLVIGLPIGALLAGFQRHNHSRLKKLTELSVMLPMGLSSIILGLVYVKLKRDIPFFSSRAQFMIIMAHTITALPFTVQSLKAGFARIHDNLREAASSLGAGYWTYFIDIELPLVRSAFSSAAAFAFAISIGEINATIMLSDKNTITLPLAIYRLIGSYNFFGACAMGTILMVLCFLVFYITDQSEVHP